MKLAKFVKRNAPAIAKIERALYTLFHGTNVHTAVSVEMNMHRITEGGAEFTIRAYIGVPAKWYTLRDSNKVDAMIAQIKHDVKEVRST